MSANSKTSPDLPRVIVPKRHLDARGWFSETFREDRLSEIGIPCRFVQENQSYSKRAGTLRGLHFQLPPAAQAKLIYVLRGSILDVVVDVRKGSPTYGKHVSLQLSAESGDRLYIPSGFAHGFMTLEQSVIVSYMVSGYYAPTYDGGIRWDDPDIAVAWPAKNNDIVMSVKDRKLPFLRDFVSPFQYDGFPLALLKTP